MKLYRVTKNNGGHECRDVRISRPHSFARCKKLLLEWCIEDPENEYSIDIATRQPGDSIDILNDTEAHKAVFSEREVLDHVFKQLERKKAWDEKEQERMEYL